MRNVLAVVPDLFFSAKISAVARAAGVTLAFAAPAAAAARAAELRPDAVIVDLHAPGAIETVRALKAAEATAAIRVSGFYSHVETDLRRAALEAGADDVLPRSAFVTRLPALLTGEDAREPS